jgi:hypothetical protein
VIAKLIKAADPNILFIGIRMLLIPMPTRIRTPAGIRTLLPVVVAILLDNFTRACAAEDEAERRAKLRYSRLGLRQY